MMVVNHQKTQLMFVKSKQTTDMITINFSGNTIQHQKTMIILGITFDEDLSYDQQLFARKTDMAKYKLKSIPS